MKGFALEGIILDRIKGTVRVVGEMPIADFFKEADTLRDFISNSRPMRVVDAGRGRDGPVAIIEGSEEEFCPS